MGLSSDSVAAPTRAQHAAGMAAYQEEGLRIAAEIGNRGPIRLIDGGRLHPDILEAYLWPIPGAARSFSADATRRR